MHPILIVVLFMSVSAGIGLLLSISRALTRIADTFEVAVNVMLVPAPSDPFSNPTEPAANEL